MPIYEFYCPDNHRIYQFYAKTLAQGRTVPPCPDNPKFRMQKAVSRFAVNTGGYGDEPPAKPAGEGGAEGDDPRMDAALDQMEREFSSVDENDPKAMGRMMRRMAELSGEKIDGEMEEMVRKLEEGADPDELEDRLGGEDAADGADDPFGDGLPPAAAGAPNTAEERARARFRARRRAPSRDPKLYDYPA
ncbi:MAG: FmdB family transcriptional regulator [Opitutaceae bacterium]|nr:FmdB family transcriptional regulator [Opitutaceae bacterium]